MRIVAPCNLFIEFIHEVRSATRLPIERTRKSLSKIWRVLAWMEESRESRGINYCIQPYRHKLVFYCRWEHYVCIRVTMIKYTSFYDRVFTSLRNSSLRLIRHFFLTSHLIRLTFQWKYWILAISSLRPI